MNKRTKVQATGQSGSTTGAEAGNPATKRLWIGVDVGDRKSEVCILDAQVVLQRERIRTTPAAVREFFGNFVGAEVAIETGTHSPWMSRELTACGLTVTVANAREVRKIHQSNRKNDRSDAEALARLLRADPELLAAVHHRSAAMQVDLTVLRARDVLVGVRTAAINAVRGLVKPFGARLQKCSSDAFSHRVADQIPSELQPALKHLLDTIAEVTAKIRAYDKQLAEIARQRYPQTALLEQVNGVGPITSLTFVLTLADAERFARSRDTGSYLGLIPRQYDSGDQHSQLPITKAGNGSMRRLLVQSAQYIMGPFGKDCNLRRFGLRLAERGGKNAKKRAVVAVARKLATLLHHLWSTGEVYHPFYGTTSSELAA
jgi:transposase